jgi:hypothetical protein
LTSREKQIQFAQLCYSHTKKLSQDFKIIWLTHTKGYQLVSRPSLGPHRRCTRVRLRCRRTQRLFVNYSVCREYLSLGRTDSTSTTLCAATTHLPVAWVLRELHRAPRLLVSRLHGLYLNLVMRRRAARPLIGQSHWLSPCPRSLHLAAPLLVVRIAPALLRLCRAFRRAVSTLDLSSASRTGSHHAPGHYVSRPQQKYFDYATRPGASACRAARRAARHRLLRLAQAHRRLLRLRRASGCLRTSRGSSRGSSRRLSPTTWTTPCIRVPRHVVRLVAPLAVNYSVDQ